MKVEVVKGKPEHVLEVVGKLREADKKELCASLGLQVDLDKVLTDSWQKDGKKWAVKCDEKVIGLFGVAPCDWNNAIGVPWLLGTNDLKKIKFSFVKGCKDYINQMLEPYKCLINFVHTENKLAIKWLTWCGFRVFQARPYGVLGQPFHMFYKE